MVENYDRIEGEVEVPDFLLEERETYVPDFARKEDEEVQVNRGALRGTAVHRVMECIDFAAFLEIDVTSEKEVEAFVTKELKRMVPNQLTLEQFALVDQKKIRTFFQSDVALRMASAAKKGDLFREKPFVMDYEGVLLQGIIDVFWLEEDKIVLLDYKTDRVQSSMELKERYKMQLDLYANALCRIFSTKEHAITSTDNLIYSFCFNCIVPLND